MFCNVDYIEEYPGSITDVSQLQIMLEKAKGNGYHEIGFILDRGYFSKDRYDAEVSKLEELMNKRDELRKKELMKAIEDSGKSFDEIIKSLREDSAEGDAANIES